MNFNIYNFIVDWAQRAIRRVVGGGNRPGRGGGRVGGANRGRRNLEQEAHNLQFNMANMARAHELNQGANEDVERGRRGGRDFADARMLPRGDLVQVENIYDDVDDDAIRYNLEGDFVRGVNFEG